MTTIGFRLISVPSAVSPLSLLSHRPNNDQSQALRHNLPITTSRRGLTMLSFLSAMPSLFLPAPATAFDIGICKHTTQRCFINCFVFLVFIFSSWSPSFIGLLAAGPKDWLREQKRKASRFLLAPIEASRGSLHAVYLMLCKSFTVSCLSFISLFRYLLTSSPLAANDSDYSNKDMEDVQRMLKSAARDCVLKDRNSFVQFQASTGVEVRSPNIAYVSLCIRFEFIAFVNQDLSKYKVQFKLLF